MTTEQITQDIKSRFAEMKKRFGVQKLAVFGSVARGEATDASDVDILVELDGPADFDRFMDLKFFLEDFLKARVDLVTSKALRPQIRASVEKEAIHVA